jgi:hypothetical protein
VTGRLGLLATACGLALAVPFWIGDFVPLVDLPQHLAVAAVLRHHGDPAWAFDRYYAIQWLELTPYWTYYLVLDGLSWLMPLDTASRVYLSLYALAVPWTGLAVCSAFGAPRWAGLLMAPLALNSNLYFGFVAFTTGVVLMLFLLARYQRFLVEPTRGRALVLAGLSAVLFLTHAQPFAFLLGAALLLAMASPAPPPTRARLLSLLVFAPATLGLLAPWLYREFVGPRSAEAVYNFGTLDDIRPQYLAPSYVVAGLAPAVAGAYQDGTDTVLFAAWVGFVAALFAVGWWRGRASHAWRGRRLALLALLGCFVAPMAIQGQWNIAPRFAWIAALLLVTAVAEAGPRLTRAGVAGALALTAAVAANAIVHHRAFDRETEGFAGALEAIPPGQRVLSLVYDTRSAVFTQWPYLHFGQYVMAFRGGAAGWSLAKSPPFPIRHLRAGDFPIPDPFAPGDFRVVEHGPFYDYFLARAGPATEVIFAGGRMPTLVHAGGGWRVWRNEEAIPLH